MNTVAKLTGIKISPDTDFDNIVARSDALGVSDGMKVPENLRDYSRHPWRIGFGDGTISPTNASESQRCAPISTPVAS